jgi:hypothetical protein
MPILKSDKYIFIASARTLLYVTLRSLRHHFWEPFYPVDLRNFHHPPALQK